MYMSKITEIKCLQMESNVSFSTSIVPVQFTFLKLLQCILLQILCKICRTPARKSNLGTKQKPVKNIFHLNFNRICIIDSALLEYNSVSVILSEVLFIYCNSKTFSVFFTGNQSFIINVIKSYSITVAILQLMVLNASVVSTLVSNDFKQF